MAVQHGRSVLGRDSWSSGDAIFTSAREATVFGVRRTDASVFQSAADVLSPNYRPIVERPAEWLRTTAVRISELAGQGHVTATESLQSFVAIMVESSSTWADVPAPFVAPLADGGFSLEFEGAAAELQLDFEASGEVKAYVFDQSVEWEGALAAIPDGLSKWVWRLSDRGV